MVENILIFILGLTFLYFGAEFLVTGSSRLAVMARIRPLFIGVTVVAFGTSSPEFLVSFIAAYSGKADVAVGNIVGSNIANIALILGISCLLRPIVIKKSNTWREMLWMLSATGLFWFFCLNKNISQIEGVFLFTGIVIFTLYLIRITLRERKNNNNNDKIPEETGRFKNFSPGVRILIYCIQTITGIAILIWGSKLTINSATEIAKVLGVSEVIIGLSLVAFGTSLPELATAIMSIIKKENAILVGNIIGSNIFNILFVGGGIASIYSLPIKERIINIDILFMIVISLVIVPFVWKSKKIHRFIGLLMLLYYLFYIVFIYINP